MGSAIAKDKDNIANKAPEHVSPALYAIAASLDEDPRSPGSRRTPMSTPFESPAVSPSQVRWHGRMIMRLGSASKFGQFDPRSPASRRTPVHATAPNAAYAAVTPLALSMSMSMGMTDPRSPGSRTPVNMSALENEPVVVPDDIVLAEEIGCEDMALEESEERQGVEQKQEAAETPRESSAGAESTCQRVTTERYLSSPEYTPSPTIIALAVSPLNSPSGSRKRKDRTKVLASSPLKKSYSAPMDENDLPNPPSPLNKPLKQHFQVRAPLSPLSQRTYNSRHCTDVLPIKLRLDPTILG